MQQGVTSTALRPDIFEHAAADLLKLIDMLCRIGLALAIVLVAVDEVHIFFLTVVSLAASYKGRLTTFIICCIIFLKNLLI